MGSLNPNSYYLHQPTQQDPSVLYDCLRDLQLVRCVVVIVHKGYAQKQSRSLVKLVNHPLSV